MDGNNLQIITQEGHPINVNVKHGVPYSYCNTEYDRRVAEISALTL